MTFPDFQNSLSSPNPPDVGPALQALWHDAGGDWKAAHDRLQDQDDGDCAWVHAYLHRKEGGASNAGCWYRRAGQPPASGPSGEEWAAVECAGFQPALHLHNRARSADNAR